MTNVVSLHLDNLGVTYRELGIEKYVHALGHNDPGLSGNSWDGVRCRKEIEKSHFKHIAKRAKTREGIPEGNGNMRDNTLIVYLSCSGGATMTGKRIGPSCWSGGMANKLKMGQYVELAGYRDPGH